MRRLFPTLFVLSLTLPLLGINSIEEQEAENSIENYYESLAKGDPYIQYKEGKMNVKLIK